MPIPGHWNTILTNIDVPWVTVVLPEGFSGFDSSFFFETAEVLQDLAKLEPLLVDAWVMINLQLSLLFFGFNLFLLKCLYVFCFCIYIFVVCVYSAVTLGILNLAFIV